MSTHNVSRNYLHFAVECHSCLASIKFIMPGAFQLYVVIKALCVAINLIYIVETSLYLVVKRLCSVVFLSYAVVFIFSVHIIMFTANAIG